jgi:hypothetical protein
VNTDFKAILAAAQVGTISPEGAVAWAEHCAAGGDTSGLSQMRGPAAWADRSAWMAAARDSGLAAQLADILTQMVDRAVGSPQPGSPQPGSPQPGDAYDRLFPADYRAVTTRPGSRPPGAQEYIPAPVVYTGESQGRPGRRPATSWDGYVTGAAEVDDPPGADDYERIFPAWYRVRCPGGGD